MSGVTALPWAYRTPIPLSLWNSSLALDPNLEGSRRLSFLLSFFFFVFLGPHPRHMEVPRLGVEWKLQLLAYTTAIAMQDLSCVCDLHHSSQQRRILNPLSEARDRTHNFIVPIQIRLAAGDFLCVHSTNSHVALMCQATRGPTFLGPGRALSFTGSYSCRPTPQPHGIRASSANYTTDQGNTRSLTRQARPGIKPASSWILVGFLSC